MVRRENPTRLEAGISRGIEGSRVSLSRALRRKTERFYFHSSKKKKRSDLGSLVVRLNLPQQGLRVPSLVKELRSRMTHGAPKTIFFRIKVKSSVHI